jgi:DNA-binding Lrp family transcriptional regulator
MSSASLLLKIYYERLHERMEMRRSQLLRRIDELLAEEIQRRGPGDMDAEKLAAYREACVAFVDERLEMYNPIGVQYTFGNVPSRMAAELEFQLNWFDSRAEFQDLVALARSLAASGVSDDAMSDLADELIRRAGAFPDRSIVAGYRAEPTLQKLPDYIVACGIEEIVCGRDPMS